MKNLKNKICSQKPYAEWLKKYKIKVDELRSARVMFTHLEPRRFSSIRKLLAIPPRTLRLLLHQWRWMRRNRWCSMGTDTPLAVLAISHSNLTNYFKQLFAQVTNPPIDPIRERIVMSLASFVGNHGNFIRTEDR